MVTVLYFAWLREQIGISREEMPLPAGVATVAGLMRSLSARGGGYASAFSAERKVRCAVNQEFADPDSPVRAGDEVGFFPPVTGG
jgi:molybdopterin converting factor subunit 1